MTSPKSRDRLADNGGLRINLWQPWLVAKTAGHVLIDLVQTPNRSAILRNG
jgi:hypothetical protein